MVLAKSLLGIDPLKNMADEELTEGEQHIKLLLIGQGITTFQLLDLLEKCENCNQNFLKFYLDKHMVDCAL